MARIPTIFAGREGIRAGWPRGAMVVCVAALLLAAGVAIGMSGCQGSQGTDWKASKPRDGRGGWTGGEPVVRVRIARGQRQLDLGGQGQLIVSLAGEQATQVAPLTYADGVRVTRRPGGYLLRDAKTGQFMQWDTDRLVVVHQGEGHLLVGDTPYPDEVHLVGRNDGTFDAINFVPMESYLPGVLARELYASWDEQTYQAQAVAARSYAIVKLRERAAHPFDVEDTTRSQVYGGAVQSRKAQAAVAATRGLVLKYRDEIIPGYYSSCTGVAGQDAAAVFPNQKDIPPLRGREMGQWDRACPHYQWGPVVRSAPALSRRIAAWGRASGHDVARVGLVRAIRIESRNDVGRPTMFVVTDQSGRTFKMDAESFRLACNAQGAAAGRKLKDLELLKSSHVTIEAKAEGHFVFNGYGFGHGVGMSQYGAQAMAMRGFGFRAILLFYYPQVVVDSAY